MSQLQEERTLKMEQNYVSLHTSGMSPKDIANEYGLSTTTVYSRLDSIAEKEGIPRDMLLDRPHGPHFMSKVAEREKLKPLDLENFRKFSSKILEEMSEFNRAVTDELEKQAELWAEYLEEGEDYANNR